MDRTVIYKKTLKGQEEMATRAHHLPSRERSVLVLVDGKRTGAELVDKSRHFGDGEAFLDRLISTGFIEPVSGHEQDLSLPIPEPLRELPHAAPSQAPRPRLPSAAGAPTSNALNETINFARHFLLGALGPDADSLAARLESSRNLKDLAQALLRGREALIALSGRRKADEFWQGVLQRLPQITAYQPD